MMFFKQNDANPPIALRWRSSTFYIGTTIFLAILVDLAAYGLVVPVVRTLLSDGFSKLTIRPQIPFRLRELGFPEEDVGSSVGWIVAAYGGKLRIPLPNSRFTELGSTDADETSFCAAGLIIASPPAAIVGALIKSRRNPLLFSLLFMAGATVLFMESTTYAQLIIARVLQGVCLFLSSNNAVLI